MMIIMHECWYTDHEVVCTVLRPSKNLRFFRRVFPRGHFRASELAELGELLPQQIRLFVGLREYARRESDDHVRGESSREPR